MAKKFNDGQTFGEIRNILNDNADDINTAQTAADNAQATADQAQTAAENAQTTANQALNKAPSVATASKAGIVKPGANMGVDANGTLTAKQASKTQEGAVKVGDNLNVNNGVVSAPLANGYGAGMVKDDLYYFGMNPDDIGQYGAISWFNGHGVPYAPWLKANSDLMSESVLATSGMMWTLSGGYANGWANPIYGLLVAFTRPDTYTHGAIGIDYTTKKLWIYTEDSGKWDELSGGGSGYTLPVASASTLGGIKIGAGLTAAADGTTRIGDSVNLPGVPTAGSSDAIVEPYYPQKLVTEGRLITGEPVGLIDSCVPTENNPVFVYLFMRPGTIVARHARVWFRAKYSGATIAIIQRNVMNGEQKPFNIEIDSGLTSGSMYMMDLTLVNNGDGKIDAYYTLTPAKFISNIGDGF